MPLSGQVPMLRRFILRRAVDVSGVSGVGIVAVGIQFPSGKCVLEWPPNEHGERGVSAHDTAAGVIDVHGHNGATVLEWIDDDPPPSDLDRAMHHGATALAFLAWVQTQAPDLWARWQAGPSAEELAGD